MNQPTPAAGLLSSGLIGYCRAGFEKELAGEIDDLAVEAGLLGFVRAEPNTGYAVFETFEPTPLGSFGAATDWRRPCFARQLLPWFARIDKLKRGKDVQKLIGDWHAAGVPVFFYPLDPGHVACAAQAGDGLEEFLAACL